MQVTVEIPDNIATTLEEGRTASRSVLEAFAADAYRNERLSRRQVGEVLGLDRWSTDEFLAKHNAVIPYGFEDAEIDRRSLRALGIL